MLNAKDKDKDKDTPSKVREVKTKESRTDKKKSSDSDRTVTGSNESRITRLSSENSSQSEGSLYLNLKKEMESLKKEIKKNGNNLSNLAGLIRTQKESIENYISQPSFGEDPEKSHLILEQLDTIENSKSTIRKLLLKSDQALQNQTHEEILFNITLDIEKELKKIDRQNRAIEWILSEAE
jgi:hypothetical protein